MKNEISLTNFYADFALSYEKLNHPRKEYDIGTPVFV